MYLSRLMIDVGSNPDRPRPGRLWLRNIYNVHQRLSMAFPVPGKVDADQDFLSPYNSGDFRKPHFLFRVEDNAAESSSRSILVLSDLQPDWNYAFRNAGVLLSGPSQCREYTPEFTEGALLRFRIVVNPSQKSVEHRKASESVDALGRKKTQGKRVALTWEAQQEPADVIIPWFARKGIVRTAEDGQKRGGFELRRCDLIALGWTVGYRIKDKNSLRFRAALLEGVLKVLYNVEGLPANPFRTDTRPGKTK